MNLQQLLLAKRATTQRVSRWSTTDFIAVPADAAYGCTAGVKYTLWVAQSNFQTKSGSEVTTGEWFIIEKA
jgi:hypothetical protein